MKLVKWLRARSTQEWMMVIVIAMLLIMIATRWGYISHTAAESVRNRFIPPAELTSPDSLQQE